MFLFADQPATTELYPNRSLPNPRVSELAATYAWNHFRRKIQSVPTRNTVFPLWSIRPIFYKLGPNAYEEPNTGLISRRVFERRQGVRLQMSEGSLERSGGPPSVLTRLPGRGEREGEIVLPERIGRLSELAYNLWWSWNEDGRQVFRSLDYAQWRASGHNTVRQLREMNPDQLKAAAADPAFLEL